VRFATRPSLAAARVTIATRSTPRRLARRGGFRYADAMTMPLSVLVVLIAALTIGMVVVLRPLRVISAKEFVVSHAFIVVGLAIILGWFWSNRDKFLEATMIMGGIWTLFGGLCLATVYVLRRKGE
jgi:hypothetical protein